MFIPTKTCILMTNPYQAVSLRKFVTFDKINYVCSWRLLLRLSLQPHNTNTHINMDMLTQHSSYIGTTWACPFKVRMLF